MTQIISLNSTKNMHCLKYYQLSILHAPNW